jgi:hypothetical protein
MLHSLYIFIHQHTDALYTPLYQGELFFFDIWSFVHFFTGIGLMLALNAGTARTRRHFLALFMLLLFWEVLEIGFVYLAEKLFRPEIIQDQITDLVVGMAGGLLGRLLHAGGSCRPPFSFASAAALAMAISFLWVTFYGYSYNYTAMNTAFLNLWAFAFWSLGLSAVIVLGRAIENRIAEFPLRMALVWLGYVAGLVALEYVGYDLLHIREMSKGIYHEPALLGLIHGPVTMKLYYFLSGLLAVLLDHQLRQARLRLRGLGRSAVTPLS